MNALFELIGDTPWNILSRLMSSDSPAFSEQPALIIGRILSFLVNL
jgi:hypothetical protein